MLANSLLAGIIVGMFVMLSGYELIVSLESKGISYLKKIIIIKIPKKYLVNFLVNSVIYFITYKFKFNKIILPLILLTIYIVNRALRIAIYIMFYITYSYYANEIYIR